MDINAKPTASFSIAQLDRRIFCGVGIEDLFQEWMPSLRDSSYYEELNNILRGIEFECGVSYGTLWDINMQEKNIFMQEILAKIRVLWKYRVTFLEETGEQAKEVIAEM